MSDNPPPASRSACILLIGNELLSGKIEDQNGTHAIEHFRARGVTVQEVRVVRDDANAIADAIRALSSSADLLVTSGGVGPTHDDVTMRAVGIAFGVTLAENEALAERIRAFYREDPDRMRVWLRMAMLPEGCELIASKTSPWPLYRMHNVYILPGIPEIFRRQFALLLAAQPDAPALGIRILHLAIGEGALAEALEAAQQHFPAVEIGSYPRFTPEGMQTSVTLEGPDEEVLDAACDWLQNVLPEGSLLQLERDRVKLSR